jgi:hypothetical protein
MLQTTLSNFNNLVIAESITFIIVLLGVFLCGIHFIQKSEEVNSKKRYYIGIITALLLLYYLNKFDTINYCIYHSYVYLFGFGLDINRINTAIDQYNTLIDKYNVVIVKYNDLAFQFNNIISQFGNMESEYVELVENMGQLHTEYDFLIYNLETLSNKDGDIYNILINKSLDNLVLSKSLYAARVTNYHNLCFTFANFTKMIALVLLILIFISSKYLRVCRFISKNLIAIGSYVQGTTIYKWIIPKCYHISLFIVNILISIINIISRILSGLSWILGKILICMKKITNILIAWSKLIIRVFTIGIIIYSAYIIYKISIFIGHPYVLTSIFGIIYLVIVWFLISCSLCVEREINFFNHI